MAHAFYVLLLIVLPLGWGLAVEYWFERRRAHRRHMQAAAPPPIAPHGARPTDMLPPEPGSAEHVLTKHDWVI